MLTNETKLELARLLPDSIEICERMRASIGLHFHVFYWKDTELEATNREWPYILLEIARRNNLARVLMLTLEASDEDIAKAILNEIRERKV